MNFLSHFYLDRMVDDSMFVVGIVTPDLLSIYNSNLRIKSGQVGRLRDEDIAAPLPFMEGLRRHFLVDRIFHSSALFTEETGFISAQLEARFPGQDIPRKFFVAHLLLELQLDQVLILRNPDLLGSFYGHFERLQPFRQVRLATEAVSGKELPNYESFLGKFTENRYLQHYRDHGHIVYVLGRLLRRVGVLDCGFLSSGAFNALMDDYHLRLDGMYGRFFDEIRDAAGD